MINKQQLPDNLIIYPYVSAIRRLNKALRGFCYFLLIVMFVAGLLISSVHPFAFLLIGLPLMIGSLALIWKVRKSSQMTDMLKTLKSIDSKLDQK